MIRRLSVVIICAMLGGCNLASMGFSSNTKANGKTVGMLAGAVGGGLIATQLCGGIGCQGIGIALGGLTGYTVGDVYDKVSQIHHMAAVQYAHASGATAYWKSPHNPNIGGVVTPTGTTNINGSECVEYTDDVQLKGETTIKSSGTICKQPDGSWKIYG